MILQVKIINGVKKLVPLTTDSGQGLPLGAITAYYGTTPPNGYLLCDGSSFDSTVYPALYTLLEDNHTPDLRECTLKGIGENPNATDHVKAGGLTLGEFQDDRLQEHTHNVGAAATGGSSKFGLPSKNATTLAYEEPTGGTQTGRSGATTEVKSVGVNYIIKAVIGPIESSEADQVVQTVNNSRSYSTDEINTGKTWIDGKPIYRKAGHYSGTAGASLLVLDATLTSSTIDSLITLRGSATTSNSTLVSIGDYSTSNGNRTSLGITPSGVCKLGDSLSGLSNINWIIEYTKA